MAFIIFVGDDSDSGDVGIVDIVRVIGAVLGIFMAIASFYNRGWLEVTFGRVLVIPAVVFGAFLGFYTSHIIFFAWLIILIVGGLVGWVFDIPVIRTCGKFQSEVLNYVGGFTDTSDCGKEEKTSAIGESSSQKSDPVVDGRGYSNDNRPEEVDNITSVDRGAASAKAELVANLKLARAELAEVNAEIAAERARWHNALAVINRLTFNKTRPVREGSSEYYRGLEASKVIQEVEAGAQKLKAKRARLEAETMELEK
jgi:hypothetical protein